LLRLSLKLRKRFFFLAFGAGMIVALHGESASPAHAALNGTPETALLLLVARAPFRNLCEPFGHSTVNPFELRTA
jgi:hypothetical protein